MLRSAIPSNALNKRPSLQQLVQARERSRVYQSCLYVPAASAAVPQSRVVGKFTVEVAADPRFHAILLRVDVRKTSTFFV
jgi:hypothetical protein